MSTVRGTGPRPAGPAGPGARAPRGRWTAPGALAVAADVVAVVVFVLVGRSSHAEHDTLTGAARTAWPFLSGLAAGEAVAAAARARLGPLATVRAGAVVVAVAVVVGHALRVLAGQGSAVSFVVVSLVVLGLFCLGWRALAGRRPRARDRRGT